MPTIMLFHIAADNCANWTTKGEMIPQMPKNDVKRYLQVR
jgi:hypothetical protein